MGLLLEGPEKVSGHPEKERDVLPPGLLVPLHAEPGNCPPSSGKPSALFKELNLSDMDGLCPGLSEGTRWFHSCSFLTKHFLRGRRLQVLQTQDQAMAPSRFGVHPVADPSQGDTHRCISRERKSRSYFINTLKLLKNKITDSTELIPPA